MTELLEESDKESRPTMDLSLYDPKIVLADMKDQIRTYYEYAQNIRGKKPYISALLLDANDVGVEVDEGHVCKRGTRSREEVLITVYYPGGGIAYAVAENPSPRWLNRAIALAEEEAYQKSNSGNHDCLMHPKNSNRFRHIPWDLGSFKGYSVDDLATRLAECEDIIGSTNGIIGSKAAFNMTIGQEIFADSLGRRTIQEFARMQIQLTAGAAAPDLKENRFELEEMLGCSGMAYDLDMLFHRAKRQARGLAERTIQFARAGPTVRVSSKGSREFTLEPATYDVVFDGAIASLAFHEFVGHSAESSRFGHEEWSGWPFKLKQKVGRLSSLNIVDNPRITFRLPPLPNEEKDPGLEEYLQRDIFPTSYYKIDQEGVVNSKKTFMVKKGRFVGYLTSRLSAGTHLDEIPGVLTGNARVGEVSCINEKGVKVPVPPDSRMSTLMALPNSKGPNLQEMLDSIRGRGLYITTGRTKAQVDTVTSHGEIIVIEVYFINKEGEKIPVRIPGYRLTIQDNAVEFMHKIRRVGNETTLRSECSPCKSYSGEIAQTGISPALLVKGVILHPQKYCGPRQDWPLSLIPSRKKAKA